MFTCARGAKGETIGRGAPPCRKWGHPIYKRNTGGKSGAKNPGDLEKPSGFTPRYKGGNGIQQRGEQPT